jgi:hypothetical protein
MSIRLRLAVLLLPFLPNTVAAQPPSQPTTEAVLERFAFRKGGPLIVPVELHGRRYPFLLDTGASKTVYDTSLEPLIGEPLSTMEVQTANGKTVLRTYRPPDARLGTMPLAKGEYVLTTDLTGLRQASDEEIRGIVGMDFLAGHVFRVDPDRGEVVFLRSAAGATGQRLAVVLGDGSGPDSLGDCPYVQAQVVGMVWPERFLVDTGGVGFGSGDLRAEAYDLLLRLGELTPAGKQCNTDAAGTTIGLRGRVKALTVGANRHDALLFDRGMRNILGWSYWSRHIVTFDFPGRTILLQPGTHFSLSDLQDRSGLHLLRCAGRMTADLAEADTPAGRAGIQPLDVVLEVDGKKAEAVHLDEVRAALCEPGRTVRLLLTRDGRTWEATLQLPD